MYHPYLPPGDFVPKAGSVGRLRSISAIEVSVVFKDGGRKRYDAGCVAPVWGPISSSSDDDDATKAAHRDALIASKKGTLVVIRSPYSSATTEDESSSSGTTTTGKKGIPDAYQKVPYKGRRRGRSVGSATGKSSTIDVEDESDITYTCPPGTAGVLLSRAYLKNCKLESPDKFVAVLIKAARSKGSGYDHQMLTTTRETGEFTETVQDRVPYVAVVKASEVVRVKCESDDYRFPRLSDMPPPRKNKKRKKSSDVAEGSDDNKDEDGAKTSNTNRADKKHVRKRNESVGRRTTRSSKAPIAASVSRKRTRSSSSSAEGNRTAGADGKDVDVDAKEIESNENHVPDSNKSKKEVKDEADDGTDTTRASESTVVQTEDDEAPAVKKRRKDVDGKQKNASAKEEEEEEGDDDGDESDEEEEDDISKLVAAEPSDLCVGAEVRLRRTKYTKDRLAPMIGEIGTIAEIREPTGKSRSRKQTVWYRVKPSNSGRSFLCMANDLSLIRARSIEADHAGDEAGGSDAVEPKKAAEVKTAETKSEAKSKDVVIETAPLLSDIDADHWEGCYVHVKTGKSIGSRGKVMGAGNGWVQMALESVGGDTLAKRAYELAVIELPPNVKLEDVLSSGGAKSSSRRRQAKKRKLAASNSDGAGLEDPSSDIVGRLRSPPRGAALAAQRKMAAQRHPNDLNSKKQGSESTRLENARNNGSHATKKSRGTGKRSDRKSKSSSQLLHRNVRDKRDGRIGRVVKSGHGFYTVAFANSDETQVRRREDLVLLDGDDCDAEVAAANRRRNTRESTSSSRRRSSSRRSGSRASDAPDLAAFASPKTIAILNGHRERIRKYCAAMKARNGKRPNFGEIMKTFEQTPSEESRPLGESEWSSDSESDDEPESFVRQTWLCKGCNCERLPDSKFCWNRTCWMSPVYSSVFVALERKLQNDEDRQTYGDSAADASVTNGNDAVETSAAGDASAPSDPKTSEETPAKKKLDAGALLMLPSEGTSTEALVTMAREARIWELGKACGFGMGLSSRKMKGEAAALAYRWLVWDRFRSEKKHHPSIQSASDLMFMRSRKIQPNEHRTLQRRAQSVIRKAIDRAAEKGARSAESSEVSVSSNKEQHLNDATPKRPFEPERSSDTTVSTPGLVTSDETGTAGTDETEDAKGAAPDDGVKRELNGACGDAKPAEEESDPSPVCDDESVTKESGIPDTAAVAGETAA